MVKSEGCMLSMWLEYGRNRGSFENMKTKSHEEENKKNAIDLWIYFYKKRPTDFKMFFPDYKELNYDELYKRIFNLMWLRKQ